MPDETLVSRLLDHAAKAPDQPLFVFLAESGAESGRLTRQDLAVQAAQLAAGLERRMAASPDVPRMALLLFPTGPGFLVAYYACLMARIVAIPVPMPLPNRPPQGLDAIVETTGLRIALCASANTETLERALAATPRLAAVELLPIETLAEPGGQPRQLP